MIKRILGLIGSEFDSTLTGAVLGLTNCMGWSETANRILRPGILRAFGLKIGKKCVLLPGLRVYCRQDKVSIGTGTFINQNLFLDAAAPITIGKSCQIGFNVTFATSSHDLDANFLGLRGRSAAPITVEDHVWIGAGAMILGGVTIGRGSVVAAGAVVTKNVPPNTLVAGTPAKAIRDINQQNEAVVLPPVRQLPHKRFGN